MSSRHVFKLKKNIHDLGSLYVFVKCLWKHVFAMYFYYIWPYWPCIVLYIWSNDKIFFARRAFSPFSGSAASTLTNSTGKTRCLQAVNCVRVPTHQEWVGTRDGWSVVVRQKNYRCRENHDTKLTDNMWYLMIGVGEISVLDRYDQDMSFVTTCRRHITNITNWAQ